MKPQLVLIGGWEFIKDDGIDAMIAGFSQGRIALIASASNTPERSFGWAKEKYEKYRTEVALIDNETKLPENLKVLYVSGGHPEKLMKYFGTHPELLNDIREKW